MTLKNGVIAIKGISVVFQYEQMFILSKIDPLFGPNHFRGRYSSGPLKD